MFLPILTLFDWLLAQLNSTCGAVLQPAPTLSKEIGTWVTRTVGEGSLWIMATWQGTLILWGPEAGAGLESKDIAREVWHCARAKGQKGESCSRQLGMSHNYRRKIRLEPGSLYLCLGDHRPYYKATNY
jgi:hypothetical protein